MEKKGHMCPTIKITTIIRKMLIGLHILYLCLRSGPQFVWILITLFPQYASLEILCETWFLILLEVIANCIIKSGATEM